MTKMCNNPSKRTTTTQTIITVTGETQYPVSYLDDRKATSRQEKLVPYVLCSTKWRCAVTLTHMCRFANAAATTSHYKHAAKVSQNKYEDDCNVN
jgi:aldehyde:ferredoxin oxidoreductase